MAIDMYKPTEQELNYNKFCFSKGCEHYIEWSFGHGRCISCKKVGQSYDILKYPDDCLFIEEISKIELLTEK